MIFLANLLLPLGLSYQQVTSEMIQNEDFHSEKDIGYSFESKFVLNSPSALLIRNFEEMPTDQISKADLYNLIKQVIIPLLKPHTKKFIQKATPTEMSHEKLSKRLLEAISQIFTSTNCLGTKICQSNRILEAIKSNLGELGIPDPILSSKGLGLLISAFKQAITAFPPKFYKDPHVSIIITEMNGSLDSFYKSCLDLFDYLEEGMDDYRNEIEPINALRKGLKTDLQYLKEIAGSLKEQFTNFFEKSENLLKADEMRLTTTKVPLDTLSDFTKARNTLTTVYKMILLLENLTNESKQEYYKDIFPDSQARFTSYLIYQMVPGRVLASEFLFSLSEELNAALLVRKNAISGGNTKLPILNTETSSKKSAFVLALPWFAIIFIVVLSAIGIRHKYKQYKRNQVASVKFKSYVLENIRIISNPWHQDSFSSDGGGNNELDPIASDPQNQNNDYVLPKLVSYNNGDSD